MKHYSGIDYLKIDIASNYSSKLEKKDFEDRINWFNNNINNMVDLLKTAEEPALFFAGLQAYSDYEEGKPSGYPISLDACSSGLQILSALINCEKSAKLCGVVSTGHREDSYTLLYNAMCRIIGESSKIKREDTKKAIMTSLYGSTEQPKRVFGEGKLLDTFYKVMETEATGAWKLNKSLQDLWQPYALSHSWVLPDNFHVVCKEINNRETTINFLNEPIKVFTKLNIGSKKGLSLSPNIIHSIDGMIVREIQSRCNFDENKLTSIINSINSIKKSKHRDNDKMLDILWKHYKYSGFLSCRVLDYIDEDNMGNVNSLDIAKLIQSMPNKSFEVLPIHDCFRVLPNYGNDLRQQYNNILSCIAKSEMLSYIASQIKGKKLSVKKYGDIADKILNADYTLS